MAGAPDLGSGGLEWTAPPAGSAPDLSSTPDSRGVAGAGHPAETRGVGLANTPREAETPRFWDRLVRFRNRGTDRKG